MKSTFSKVCDLSEIPVGKMKHFEVNGKEIMIANVDGKFYAISDRCGHMNARLSMGTLDKNVVTCPLHLSRFDITTGKVISGPTERTGGGNLFEKCPEEVQKTVLQMVQHTAEIQKFIKTQDQPTYPIEIEDNNIFVNVKV